MQFLIVEMTHFNSDNLQFKNTDICMQSNQKLRLQSS